MKKILLFLSILCIPLISLMSCSKETYRQTIMMVTLKQGRDNMLHNSPFGCYPGDYFRTYDTVFKFNSIHPDTAFLYKGWQTYAPTGRIDSSFVYAGQLVTLIGPIEHREYTDLVSINKIVYGTE